MRVVESSSRIDLLTPDVGSLNGMNGRRIADAARTHGSEMKVLFITGYAECLARQRHLGKGMQVGKKPFDMELLSGKIRALVDG